MYRNQPIRTYRRDLLYPLKEALVFLRGPLDWVTEVKNVNVSCNFDLRSHFNANHGNGREEIACRWKKKKQRVKQNKYFSWVLCKVSNRKTLSGEIFCFLGKRLPWIYKLCASSNFLLLLLLLLFFLWVAGELTSTELSIVGLRIVRKCSLPILLW